MPFSDKDLVKNSVARQQLFTRSLKVAKHGHVAFIFLGICFKPYANLISITEISKKSLPESTGFDKNQPSFNPLKSRDSPP